MHLYSAIGGRGYREKDSVVCFALPPMENRCVNKGPFNVVDSISKKDTISQHFANI